MKASRVETYPSAMRAYWLGYYYPAARRVEQSDGKRFVEMHNLAPQKLPLPTLDAAVAEARRIMGWPL